VNIEHQDSNPGKEIAFSFRYNIQIGVGARTASYPTDTSGCSLRGVKLTTHLI